MKTKYYRSILQRIHGSYGRTIVRWAGSNLASNAIWVIVFDRWPPICSFLAFIGAIFMLVLFIKIRRCNFSSAEKVLLAVLIVMASSIIGAASAPPNDSVAGSLRWNILVESIASILPTVITLLRTVVLARLPSSVRWKWSSRRWETDDRGEVVAREIEGAQNAGASYGLKASPDSSHQPEKEGENAENGRS